MFKKKPTVKALAPVRSSDRRRVADQIISEYHLDEEQSRREAISAEDKAAQTAERTSLRNSLLPDNIQSARFTTTHGPDLKQQSGTLYVGSHPHEDARVLWFKIEEQMYPSVYTLWRHPGLVPLLHTPDIVVQKLQGGADLMTPGLAGPPFPPNATKGSIVAIASIEKPSVPVAVGTSLIDIASLRSVQGVKGHAVQTVHWAGDEVWAYSTSGKAGSNPPEDISGWLKSDSSTTVLAQATSDLDIQDDDEDGGVPLAQPGAETTVEDTSGNTAASETEESASKETRELTTKEVDEAFRNAFLYGVHHYRSTNKDQPSFGLSFPLSQSFVMSNLVQPFLPAFTPEEATALQIKKSGFKNIKKFIKSLDKGKILKSKERDGHETTIVDIDFKDPAIVEFKPYALPKKETQAGTSLGRGEKATTVIDTGDPSVGQQITIGQVYKPHSRLSPFFISADPPAAFYTTSQIKECLGQYVDTAKLVSETNKRLVKLDPFLANDVFDGTQRLDKEVHAKGQVPRDALLDRIMASCSPYHTITSSQSSSATTSTKEKDHSKPKAGQPPKVRIVLETRSGNKTVTKVSGLEVFHIPPQPLADELRKTCAGSTSVEQLAGSSPKTPVMEIMVQGPQKDAVVRALTKRGVKGPWIEVDDKVKGKKR